MAEPTTLNPPQADDGLLSVVDKFFAAEENPAPTPPAPAPEKVAPTVTPPEGTEPPAKKAKVPTSLEDSMSSLASEGNDEAEPEEKKPKEPAEDPDELPEGQGEKAQSAWAKLRQKEKKAREELAQLREELASKKTVETKEFDRLRKEREELETRLFAHRVEESPKFIREVVEPLNAMNETVARLFKDDAPKIIKAMLISDERERYEEVEAALDGQPSVIKTKVMAMLPEIERIEAVQAALLKDSKATLASLKAEEEAAQMQAASQAREETGAIVDNLVKHIPLLADHKASLLESAQGIEWGKVPARQQAFSVVAALAVPMLNKEIQAQKATINQLNRQLKALSGASPSGGGTPSANPTSTPVTDGGFAEAVLKNFGMS